MEVLAIQVDEQRLLDNGKVYATFKPTNSGIQDKATHCASLTIVTTAADAITLYTPTAKSELLAALNRTYPGQYS